MSQEYANAYPRKKFFIQMFTKDIGLEDCILDLVDNSIDGFIRSRKIGLSKISRLIFSKNGRKARKLAGMPTVRVAYSESAVTVEDNCGGIDFEYAQNEAFNFGHGKGWEKRKKSPVWIKRGRNSSLISAGSAR